MDDDIDGVPLEKTGNSPVNAAGFIPSKWETVDPDQIEAQAITTSKWDTLDPVAPDPPAISTLSEDSFDSFENNESNRDFDEEKRIRLREVELKTVQYQDELESGQRSLKSGWSVQQQIEHYRRKLMKRTRRDLIAESPQSSAGRSGTSLKRSPSPLESAKKAKKSKRSPSPAYSRTTRRKSRSPIYAKKSSRDSISPPKGGRTLKRDRNRSRSHSQSRSSSISPKRYGKDRLSPSPVRLSKYDSPPRRYR